MAVVDCTVMKGRRNVVPKSLQQGALEQLHINHMDIEKARLLARETIFSINVNADFGNAIKHCSTCLAFHATQLKDKPISHDIPCKPWETVGPNMFMLNNETYLCIVDYLNKLPVMKLTDGCSAYSLNKN